jgi:hypothetical protein
VLTGSLLDSTPFTATDLVTVVPTAGPVVTIHDDGSGYSASITTALDHQFQTYTLADCVASVIDRCGNSLDPNSGHILRITSDEAPATHGASSGASMQILSSSSFAVRRERDAQGDGRVYTVVFTVSDAAGDTTQASCSVQVPHDAHGRAVDSGAHACTGTGCP